MAYEFGEMDARIFVAILRIVCAVVGIACLVEWGGGILWKMTPNGMLPALNLIGFSLSVLLTAIYSRWWQWALAAVGCVFLSL